MEPIYRKIVNEETGEVTYEPVDLAQVELPAEHPINVELNKVKAESIERRNRLKALKQQRVDDTQEQGDPTSAKPEKAVPVQIDPEEVARKAAEILAQRQAEAAKQQAEHQSTVAAILRETGLSETFKPVIEAIPDPAKAREAAVSMVRELNRFGNPPSGGNGERDASTLLAAADAKLGLAQKK